MSWTLELVSTSIHGDVQITFSLQLFMILVIVLATRMLALAGSSSSVDTTFLQEGRGHVQDNVSSGSSGSLLEILMMTLAMGGVIFVGFLALTSIWTGQNNYNKGCCKGNSW